LHFSVLQVFDLPCRQHIAIRESKTLDTFKHSLKIHLTFLPSCN